LTFSTIGEWHGQSHPQLRTQQRGAMIRLTTTMATDTMRMESTLLVENFARADFAVFFARSREVLQAHL
jgi:hypothetical protein